MLLIELQKHLVCPKLVPFRGLDSCKSEGLCLNLLLLAFDLINYSWFIKRKHKNSDSPDYYLEQLSLNEEGEEDSVCSLSSALSCCECWGRVHSSEVSLLRGSGQVRASCHVTEVGVVYSCVHTLGLAVLNVICLFSQSVYAT